MAKRIQVGGRIESKEVGGIVTGAAEILDDAKEKKQSVINQETGDELVRLEQSKQDNLTFDNAPTEGSDNPVKSGGVYTAQQAILLAIVAINELIPSAASALNQLADKAFVNSSISTNTATFRGTSAAGLNEQQFLAWANGLTHDLNDYVFWQTSDAAGNTLFKRYKWNGTEWAYEYTLNNSTFTAEQWEAIQSGITALLVTKLRALPTAQELIQSFDGKQDVLTFDDVPTLGSNNPVKSSGIYNVIKAITDLIPAEATAQNQLADKADVAAKIVAAIPSWKGQYDALADLQAVTGAKAGDMGCVKTTDSDGHAVLTFYQYSAQGAWVVYYVLRHYAQNKPATTGTTGDYPYNGMGRIELQKNIVNGVNTLTQAMLTQQNTIYVIQYDFTLGEDVTVPANCVLEFDGGSISGAYTITGLNTGIIAGDVKLFNTNVILAGTWNGSFNAFWYGLKPNDSSYDNGIIINKAVSVFGMLYVPDGTYYFQTPITIDNVENYNITINGTLIYNGVIQNSIAFQISDADKINVQINRIEVDKNSIVYTTTNNTNAIGIRFKNCKNCNIYITSVYGFNTGVCFMGDGAGCCYNAIIVKSIRTFNYGIWLTQDNGGWTNENYISGCHFQIENSTWDTSSWIMYPVYMAGGSVTDTYNKINEISIKNCCMESFGNHPLICMKNASYIYTDFIRAENSNIFIKAIGACMDISIDEKSYGTTNYLEKLDLTEVSSFLLLNEPNGRDFIVDVPSTITEDIVLEGYQVIRSGAFQAKYRPYNNSNRVGATFVKNDLIPLFVKIIASNKIRYAIKIVEVVDDNMNIIQDFNPENYPPKCLNYVIVDGIYTIQADRDSIVAILDKHVTKAFVGIALNQTTGNKATISSNATKIEYTEFARYGNTANRPVLAAGNSGFEYYDSEIGKMIFWNGTAWVDATGTPV